MDRRKRTAFYGGTFDPVHLGHLAVAEKVLRLFEIDELRFVPAQVAPHKVSHAVTPALHRYAMLALATQDNARLLASSFELDGPERSYTVDTLAHFKADLAETSTTFFVMGADSWSEITSWRDWERLLAYYDHPQAHWLHLRTSNPVESPFASARLRTSAEASWRSNLYPSGRGIA